MTNTPFVPSAVALPDLQPGDVLWVAPDERGESCSMRAFLEWLGNREGRTFADHDALWAWSVAEIESFWAAVWEYVGIEASSPYSTVLTERQMPGASWFPGARLNYAEHCLRPGAAEDPALICLREPVDGELGTARTISRGELRQQVAALAAWLRGCGVVPGDRVCGYLPNTEHAVISCLAAATVGAVWSLCAPDFGAEGAADRIGQLQPTVLVVADGYHWNGRSVDRRETVTRLARELPTVRAVLWVPYAFAEPSDLPAGTHRWADVIAREAELDFEQVEFSHPLWVLFSSGTTGSPKGLVHGHGGMTLTHLMWMRLYVDLRAADRFFACTSTGWMLWNLQVSALAAGGVTVLYEGSPGYPDPGIIWDVTAQTKAKVVVLGASLVAAVQNAGIEPNEQYDLSALATLLVSGSALSMESYPFIRERIGAHVRLDSTSGGTDICGAFVGGNDLLPVRVGEISGPLAGVALASWGEGGDPLVGRVGELVVTAPLPSMPLFLWGDSDGTRYRDTYFDMWPGVWRHGDWITVTERNSVVMHGRSDATLNRDGVRLGTSDFYDLLDAMPEIRDSLVVGIDRLGDGYYLPLFVVLAEGHDLDEALIERIRRELRTKRSPRHVPDEIVAAPAIPRTLTGKRLEVPIKRLMSGVPLDHAVNLSAVDDPAAVRWFAEFAVASSGVRAV